MNTAVTGTAQAAKQTQWQIDPAHSARAFQCAALDISMSAATSTRSAAAPCWPHLIPQNQPSR